MSDFWQRIGKWWDKQPEDKEIDPIEEVRRILSALVEEKKLPGIAVTAIKNGRLEIQGGWGYADLESKIPMHPVSTLTRAASASKPIAATALGKLVASGQMDWDTSFYDYVPYFPKKAQDFTIRQLAGHTAGIRSYRGKEYAQNQPFTIRDSLAIFQEDPLLFVPGTSYHYNSFDWVMLSLAMEEVSGRPFASYVESEILKPLELHDTMAEVPGMTDSRVAQFYTKSRVGFRKATPVDNRYKLAGGGYLTTAEDLARFGLACLEGKVLEADIMNEIWKAQKIAGQSTYYGLGWEVSEDKKGRPYYGHRGNSVGAYTNFYIYPEQKAVFVALINCSDPGVQDELDQVIDIVLTT